MHGAMSRGEKIFHAVNTVFMILVCAVMLYPVLMVLGRSLMSDIERATHPLRLFPTKIDWSGYQFILSPNSNIGRGYMVTIARTVIGTGLSLIVTSLLAYPLSKKDYPGRKVITALIVFTMWFSGGMIPNFLLIKSLGLMNNFWVFVLPMLVSAYNLIILRNFFMQISESLEEAAKLDGAGDFTIYRCVYLPLSTAAMATIALFYAIAHWNSWFDALLYINDQRLWPMQYILRQLISSASVSDIATAAAVSDKTPAAETVKMATIVVSTVPILCVYPFLQRYFVKGVLVGSVKG
ncbi:MAG: carbohydrate ABC transporter permease [Clostridiales bacterium]|nr:carbohydrate ABC transporter permease [Clostridiales bacterium]MDY2834652.1 carbohydrate ABC transporter permease [Candidatus Aphodomonas sp.]